MMSNPVATPGSQRSHTEQTESPLVQVEHIGKVFDVSAPWLNRIIERKPRQLLQAVRDVSFSIARGETLALVGESGCGKSTVARLLVGLYRPSSGRVLFDGRDLGRLEGAEGLALRRRMQMIFQDPYASLNPRWRVARIIAEPLRVHRLIQDPRAIEERVEALLTQVGLAASDAGKFPHQFSGGSRSPGHSPPSPSSWSATSPRRLWTCRSRPRC